MWAGLNAINWRRYC